MNKKLLSFLFITIFFLIGAIYYTNIFQSPIIRISNRLQSLYLSSTTYFVDAINKHVSQTKHIELLQKQLKKYKKTHLIAQQLSTQLNQLLQENNSTLSMNPKIELVRAISYAKFSNLNKLWIDMPDFNQSKIYGLVYQEKVAGIVIAKDKKPLALLVQDPKCSYPVYIGHNNAPGIAHGNNSGTIIVNYIPLWIKIKIHDKVTTSGLGKLFFRGLSVGRVTKITKAQGYQRAIVQPSFISNTLNYFYVIKRVL